jgi:hypothetical protein
MRTLGRRRALHGGGVRPADIVAGRGSTLGMGLEEEASVVARWPSRVGAATCQNVCIDAQDYLPTATDSTRAIQNPQVLLRSRRWLTYICRRVVRRTLIIDGHLIVDEVRFKIHISLGPLFYLVKQLVFFYPIQN